MILNNRLVLVTPTRKTGALDADGYPITEPAPGYHVNIDPAIFTDPATQTHAQALLTLVSPYNITEEPYTHQYEFTAGKRPILLRFPDEATALALGAQAGVSDGLA